LNTPKTIERTPPLLESSADPVTKKLVIRIARIALTKKTSNCV
jgi:hypothetical protein